MPDRLPDANLRVSFPRETAVFRPTRETLRARRFPRERDFTSASATDVNGPDETPRFAGRSTSGIPPVRSRLQETYLSPRLLAAAGAPAPDAAPAHAHFTLRTRREPKRRLPTVSSHKGSLAHASSNPDLAARAVSANAVRRPAPNAAASMFAPPARKPGASFLRDSAPRRRGAASAKSFLSRAREGSTKTMLIDVSEAAQLGTVKGEDLRAEQARREKEEAARERELKRARELEERQERVRKMMEERETKKKQEAERKRARDEETARRKAEMASKRARTEAPRDEGTATPSPKEPEPIHG